MSEINKMTSATWKELRTKAGIEKSIVFGANVGSKLTEYHTARGALKDFYKGSKSADIRGRLSQNNPNLTKDIAGFEDGFKLVDKVYKTLDDLLKGLAEMKKKTEDAIKKPNPSAALKEFGAIIPKMETDGKRKLEVWKKTAEYWKKLQAKELKSILTSLPF